jgi:hypothetical protein
VPVKRARNEESASDETHRIAALRRKVPYGRVNREARVDAKVIRKAIGQPRKPARKAGP